MTVMLSEGVSAPLAATYSAPENNTTQTAQSGAARERAREAWTHCTHGGHEMLNDTWDCGAPKSTGNAFDWKPKPAPKKEAAAPKRVGRPAKTVSELKKLATRVNKHDPITAKSSFDFDAKQKLVRTRI